MMRKKALAGAALAGLMLAVSPAMAQQQQRDMMQGQMGQPGQMGPQGQMGQQGQMGRMGQQGQMGPQGMMQGQRAMAGECPVMLGPQAVEMVQEQLRAQGYELAVDGVWGPETSQAVQQFQREQGLRATGRLSFRTLANLGVDIQQLASAEAAAEPMEAQTPGMQQDQQQ